MTEDWRDEFEPHILVRGRKYFEEGRVMRIQRCGDRFVATVAGTTDYTVAIDVARGELGIMKCDCPYAARGENNCKHMAAVLYALERGTVAVEELPPAKKPVIVSRVLVEVPWTEAIDKLPEDMVRRELRKRAERDAWLQERLAVLYLGKLPDGQIQNWKADLQEIAEGYTDCTGRIDDDAAWEFLDELTCFLKAGLPLLLEVGAVMDAFHLIWIVMETALEWENDDDHDGLADLAADCRDAYAALLLMATAAQREQMRQWYQEHRDADWSGGVEYMDSVFGTADQ